MCWAPVIERGHYTNGARMGSSWSAGIYFVRINGEGAESGETIREDWLCRYLYSGVGWRLFGDCSPFVP